MDRYIGSWIYTVEEDILSSSPNLGEELRLLSSTVFTP